MVWGADGLMNGAGNPEARVPALDFAGGTVVHMSSGWSAPASCAACMILGPRIGFGREHACLRTAPCSAWSAPQCLWVGWYGFNAGSALAADGIAAQAFMTTTLATAVGSFTWGALEYYIKKHASILGFCSGAVGGLVVITPAAELRERLRGAVIIGVLAGAVPFLFCCVRLKAVFGYDDALDTLRRPRRGRVPLGALLTGILATASVNPNLTSANPAAKANGLADVVAQGSLWREQLVAMGVTLALAVVATTIIAFALKATFGTEAPCRGRAPGARCNRAWRRGLHHVT